MNLSLGNATKIAKLKLVAFLLRHKKVRTWLKSGWKLKDRTKSSQALALAMPKIIEGVSHEFADDSETAQAVIQFFRDVRGTIKGDVKKK
jgi:hypothetical protein